MSSLFNARCPLCGFAAQFQGLDYGRQKHFFCPLCVEFYIDAESEHRLKSMAAEFSIRHSNHAKRSSGQEVWVIRAPNTEEWARDQSLTMIGEFPNK
jgi:hypothetical protein